MLATLISYYFISKIDDFEYKCPIILINYNVTYNMNYII